MVVVRPVAAVVLVAAAVSLLRAFKALAAAVLPLRTPVSAGRAEMAPLA